jgi:hypothetical protein
MATISEKRKTTWLQIFCILCGVIGMPGIMITHVTPHRSDAIFTTKNFVTILSLLCLITFFWVSFRLLRHFSNPGQKVKSLASSYLFMTTGSYTILVLFVLLFQDIFIDRNSVMFQPKTISRETAASFVSDTVQALEFVTPDRVHLSGWLVKNSPRDRSPLILYFGGSSQEVSNMIPYFQGVEGWSTALVNYRGYGLSEGNPSEENFFQDAALIYDTLSKREDIDSRRIVPMGWSLGTGVAVYLSEQRPVHGAGHSV